MVYILAPLDNGCTGKGLHNSPQGQIHKGFDTISLGIKAEAAFMFLYVNNKEVERSKPKDIKIEHKKAL